MPEDASEDRARNARCQAQERSLLEEYSSQPWQVENVKLRRGWPSGCGKEQASQQERQKSLCSLLELMRNVQS